MGGQSRQTKHVDSFSFFWSRWWVGSNTALCNTLWKNIVKDGLAVHGLAPFLFPYPKPKAPQSQITVLRTYSFRLCVDCNVGAPRGIAHCIQHKSRRSTHKLRLQGSQWEFEMATQWLIPDNGQVVGGVPCECKQTIGEFGVNFRS